VNRTFFILALAGGLAGCSSLLPRSKETSGAVTTAWQSYEEAEAAFAKITPGATTVRDLAALRLDPHTNPNINIVPRFAVMQRFMVNRTVTLADLDDGVRDCINAQNACVGWEIDQTAMQKKRNGNAALDMLKMRRETHSSGWHFAGLLLIKDGVVLYKLAGGQPLIHDIAQTEDLLGPLQAIGTKLNAVNGIDVTDVRNGIKALAGGNSGHVEPVTAIKIR
jgi:hypothetical protein